MTDLSDFTDSLRRMVATPGTFDTVFPNTTDEDLVGSLVDGLAEAQLDGFFIKPTMYDYDSDGIVTPDLTQAQLALIVIYAGSRIIQAEILARNTLFRAKAGPVEFETQQSANALTTILKDLEDRKKAILALFQNYGAGSAFTMADSYFIKATGYYPGMDFSFGEDFNRSFPDNPYGGF